MPAEEPYHVLADGVRQDTATAMLQQSAALMALVAHLINQDTGLDFAGVSGGAATSSTKGTMRREKMQQDLAARKSSFFLQVQQKIFKKLHPSKLLPKTEEELAVSTFHAYLPGTIWWLQGAEGDRAAHVADGTRYGCGCLKRLLSYKGVPSAGGRGFGAKCIRCGRLVTCLRFGSCGGSSSKPFSRKDGYNHSCRTPFLTPGPSDVGIYESFVRQGARGAINQEIRDKGQEATRSQSERAIRRGGEARAGQRGRVFRRNPRP